MPRKARIISESGIYHIILRGINQQQIFEDNEDSEKFIQVLKDCKAISGFKIFAYCLMGNHIHLLRNTRGRFFCVMKKPTVGSKPPHLISNQFAQFVTFSRLCEYYSQLLFDKKFNNKH